MTSNKVPTFDGAAPPGTINFGIGQPSPDLLPLELVGQASSAFFAGATSIELNYGVLEGDARFLDSLAEFLTEHYAAETKPEELFVTGGNSQALDMVSTMLAQPGDTVFVEDPSYFLAFQILRDHNLDIVGIPVDDDGLRVDKLQEALDEHRPAFLYTIPSFHNPGGQCTSAARRRQIVELAFEHDFLIVADEVYQLLYYYDPPPPAYGTMTDSDRVVSMGSFSKILAPGMRLGWIQASARLRNQVGSIGFVNSGGSINHISSLIARQAIDSGTLTQHIGQLRQKYRSRVDAMHDALRRHFSDIGRWTRPDGGYFFWIELDAAVDTTPLKAVAEERETGFQPGSMFSPHRGHQNCLRLSFAHYDEDDIRKGVARLRTVFE